MWKQLPVQRTFFQCCHPWRAVLLRRWAWVRGRRRATAACARWVWVKIKPGETAGFGPCCHLAGFHFGHLFLNHNQVEVRLQCQALDSRLQVEPDMDDLPPTRSCSSGPPSVSSGSDDGHCDASKPQTELSGTCFLARRIVC